MTEPASIKVETGERNQDNQAGNFFNALDQVVSYYQANSTMTDEMVVKTLYLYSFSVEED